jgi:hypothetical protein
MTVFMTFDKNYWKEIGISENAVYDDYIKSDHLKAYLDELGLTKDLIAGNPQMVRPPTTAFGGRQVRHKSKKALDESKDANALANER